MPRADAGHLVLRIAVGGMLFVVHGLHKGADALAWIATGADWPLVREVAATGAPLPFVVAAAATLVQLVCPLGLILGWHTRVHASLLAAVLLGAVGQNLSAHRDPQLALLYLSATAALALLGAGRIALDARRDRTAATS